MMQNKGETPKSTIGNFIPPVSSRIINNRTDKFDDTLPLMVKSLLSSDVNDKTRRTP